MSGNDVIDSEDLVSVLEALAGQRPPFPDRVARAEVSFGTGTEALGYSQLNELLLLAGLDRVHESFFAYLLTGHFRYETGSGFSSLQELKDSIERFRKAAVVIFGNVKFAFKTLSTDPDVLEGYLAPLESIPVSEFANRHAPVLPIVDIAPEDAYLTGYISGSEIQERLQEDPNDKDALALKERRDRIVEKSILNQEAYYASDHLDVYVATSMRKKHEYVAVRHLCEDIFTHSELVPLNLRWFDPTQAYCPHRIDKGLAEALMLKRVSCTIYLVQAADTLGKDSELASTLAQGKPVIAYVPEVDEAFLKRYFNSLFDSEPDAPQQRVLLEQIHEFAPEAAWSDDVVREWIDLDPSILPEDDVSTYLAEKMRSRYDRRARLLSESHPLGIQVTLNTGVATGVLVARTPEQCATIVRAIVTRSLEFYFDETEQHTLLREAVSNSIFRVVTKDDMLTNAFWNFYLDRQE